MPKTEEKQAVKAVIYARYSSDRQREESIEGQLRVCEDYASRNNMTILHTYADRAMTGRSDQRPEFQMMIRDAATMTFDVVLVYKLNRFARNRYDSAKYKHKLKKYGIKVVSAMENIADDPSGILLESVIEGMAEYYSAELAENVMRGMTENALEGKWPGGVVPLGYKLDEQHHLVIDGPKAEVVRLIYQLALEGHNQKYIIDELNRRHYTNSAGGQFSYNTLRTILRNEKYIGVFTWGTVRRENACLAILDKATFEAVQEHLNFRTKHHIRSCNEDFLLTGKLFCGCCRSKMIGVSGTSKTGAIYYYYACAAHLKKKCKTRNIRKDAIEDLVCEVTTRILSSKEAVEAIARQAIEMQKNKKDSLELQAIKNQIADINKKLQNCVKAVENGLVSETITNHINNYEKELTRLKDDAARVKLLDGDIELDQQHIEFFFWSIAQKIKAADKYKSILLSSIVRSVIVNEDYIEIQYNYKNELPILQNPVKVESSHLNQMVTQEGFEPTTHRLEGGCSIQLSY